MVSKLELNKARLLLCAGLFGLMVLALLQLSGCKSDEPEMPVVVEFSAGTNSVLEGSEIVISVAFSKKPVQNGFISIAISGNANYGEDYFTTPAGDLEVITLPVTEGESVLNFKVTTLANTVYEGDKTILFTVTDVPSGFTIGDEKSLTLTITDDEQVAIAGFSESSGSVAENSPVGIMVNVPFSLPTKGPGSVTVSIASNNAVYGTNFTTLPAATNNTILLDVSNNTSGASFTIIPIDDDFFHADFTVAFEMTAATGSVKIGANNFYSLTITEDESPALANFDLTGFSIPETDEGGIIVQIPLSEPASETGTITVSLSSTATYGANYVTVPAASGGKIFLDVAKGADHAEFTVKPVDDAVDNENRVVTFTLTNATGAIRLGTALTYTLTILDNEPSLRTVLISFGRASAPLVGGTETWNHAYDDSPSGGDTWNNLLRSDGVQTSIGILMNSSLTPQPLGKVTGINSGTFPDNALKEYWYVPGPNQGITRSFSITQLSNSVLYSFKIIGGTTQVSPDGRNTMTVSVNGEQKSILDVTNNVSTPLIWVDKAPSASIITINLTDTDGGGICPINAMEISWYEED